MALEDVSRRFSSIDAHYTILIGPDDEVSNGDMWMPSVEHETTERMAVQIGLAVEYKLRCQLILLFIYGV